MTCRTAAFLCIALVVGLTPHAAAQNSEARPDIRIGIIGLDTSHAIAFTKELNSDPPSDELSGLRVVAAYPKGSPDIPSSVSRVPEYTKAIRELGVEIVDSVDELVARVDAVLLETNDGRPHLEQSLPVLLAHKPVFVDKPIAGSLSDAIAIFLAAEKFGTPVFSSSSLRFVSGAQQARNGSVGEVRGCDAFSPCPLEPSHPDLYWYGIHGAETLFTVMGAGCQGVRRTTTPETDLVVGIWKGGRIGTLRGIRDPGRGGYGGTAFGTTGIQSVGSYEGYRPLVIEIGKFFRTGKSPVARDETLEIYAFMSAADESKRLGGDMVTLESVMQTARKEAIHRLAELGIQAAE